MNEADKREARTGSVADRVFATISIPAVDLAGEAQATHGVRARGQFHAAHGHLEDICSARCIERVRPREEARERLAVVTVADEAETRVRPDLVRNAAHVAAPATKREILGVLSHRT